jgi:hypothetical protein
MSTIRRAVKVVLGVTGFLLYTWYESVHLAPLVKRRKAMRRRADRRR